jgi:predicted Rossmann fold flavoprotein
MPSTTIGQVSHAAGSARTHDLLVVGGGAAGMLCAALAGQRGLDVALLDHFARPGEKIRISGGGRCNFTNLDAGRVERYSGADARFLRPALRAFGPERFIAQIRAHRIGHHEKHKGQLFCDDSAERIIAMLLAECQRGAVREYRPCRLQAVRLTSRDSGGSLFEVDTDAGMLRAHRLVIATGGLSIPKIGATDLGYRIARQFGHRVVEPRPALVPLTFESTHWAPWASLAGVSAPVRIRCGDSPVFDDDLLFTHRGLSGPALLQASTFWRPGEPIAIDLGNGAELLAWLRAERDRAGARPLAAALAEHLPRRLAQTWVSLQSLPEIAANRRLAELGNPVLAVVAQSLSAWQIAPNGSEGFRKAEVTAGGVSCAEIDPRSLESLRQPGLYFIGEVLDVTGWLGGYNFQWAWSSAYLAAAAMAAAAGR